MVSPKINVKDNVNDGEIDLSMSDLQEVPVKEIAAVKKAHSLDLSNNHLTSLPKTFALLINLTKIDLSKNELKELPENFGDLFKLKHLDLYKNQLQHLPLSFSKLTALRWLDLKDNPLVPSIADIAGPCLDAKQCQSCARDIVNLYAQLQIKVEEERKSREEQRQKSLEENAAKVKQEKKVKKSKSTKKQTEKVVPVNKISETHTHKLKLKNADMSKTPVNSSVSLTFIVFVFKFLSILTLFFGISMIILRFTKVKYGSVYEDKLRDFILELNIPPQLKVITSAVHEYVVLAQKCIGNLISELASNQNVKIVFKAFSGLYRNVTEAGTDLYLKLFVE